MLQTIGIYQITNLENGKIYIGASSNIKNRWHRHIGALRRNNHTISELQNDYNNYGEKSFIIDMFQLCQL